MGAGHARGERAMRLGECRMVDLPKIWRETENFSSGGVCLPFGSDFHDPHAYYRDYGESLDAVRDD